MPEFDYSLHYRRFHDDSEEHAEVMAGWIAETIKPHLPSTGPIRALDVGCGYGFTLRALHKLGVEDVNGLEVSQEQAAHCTAAGLKVEVVSDSALWLRGHPAQFGIVLLFDVLEHIPRHQQIDFARAIHECLVPGGKLLLTVPNANAILASRWRYIDFTHHSSFTEHSLDFVLRNAGFDDIRIDASKGIGRFPRRFWLRRNWPAIRKQIIRRCWLQVFKAELPGERLENISFDLNLTAAAVKRA
jgi:SAM-dependent methyltransferase